MADFTTRVELHRATESDYEKLHHAMAAEGFSRLIQSDDGIRYHLPTAEYVRSGDFTRSQILEAAKRAASITGRTYAVFVTQATSWTWIGLPVAQGKRA
jgi:hypothetical protein